MKQGTCRQIITKIHGGRDKDIVVSLCFLLLCQMPWRSVVLWANPEPAIQHQKTMVMDCMIFFLLVSLFFSFWEVQKWTELKNLLREATSSRLKLSKVIFKFERPCVSLMWWGAKDWELAATWNSNKGSYPTSQPLWWTDFSLNEGPLFTLPTAGSS